ncbi:MAG: serine hydrolase [Thermomicrobiales bacterium]
MNPPQIDMRTARLLVPIAIASGIAVRTASTLGATPAASPTGSPPASPAASPIAQVDDAGIPQRISSLLKGEDGVYGIMIAREDGKVLYSRNSGLPFLTASLYKLILMADIYRKIERGDLGQQDSIELDWSVFGEDGESYFGWDQVGSAFPLQEYLFAAGAYSSNAAAWTLFTLTSSDDLAQTAADIGLTRTYIIASLSSIPSWPFAGSADATTNDVNLATAFVESWGAGDESVSITTPRDMAIYFQALLTNTLLSPWISRQITAILAQQAVRDRIPALLPANTPTINKTGNLDSIVNDAGIIDLPSGPRIVILLSEAMPDDTRATLILQRLALIATGATVIPPLDVPDPAGLDTIDTTDPSTWAPEDDGSDDTESGEDGDQSDAEPTELPDDGD